MRYLLALLLFASCAPKINYNTTFSTPFEFTLVDTVVASKNTLYSRAISWSAKTFISSQAVIDVQDKEEGKIICKPVIDISGKFFPQGGDINSKQSYVRYMITIEVKENKYRCKLSDFYHYGSYNSFGFLNAEKPNVNKNAPSSYAEYRRFYLIKEYVQNDALKTIQSLKDAMRTKENDF